MRKAAPLEADDIETGERGAVAERHAVGDDIVLDPGEAADEGVRADPDELMRRRPAAEDRRVADLAMARQHHVVGEDDVVAELAIMRDMGIGEEHAARPDDRLRAAAGGAGIHRDALADQAILADPEAHRLAAIFEVLRLMADRGEGKDARPRADLRVARDAHMGHETDPVAERDLGADVAERADLDPGAEPGAVLDDGARMDNAGTVTGSPASPKLRLADERAVDLGLAAEPPHVPLLDDAGHVELDLVARHDRLAELRLVDGHEVDDARASALPSTCCEATQSAPAVCAIPSISNTPGITGRPGKWPWKCGSLTVTFLMPTPDSSPRVSTMRSTSRNG